MSDISVLLNASAVLWNPDRRPSSTGDTRRGRANSIRSVSAEGAHTTPSEELAGAAAGPFV